MESKKTFGEYICKRRKELGLTQKEFAEKLYVTESAVSKWERGMSYPDITLLLDICAVLDVTEHELLTSSMDTRKRAVERMAEKYRRLTRNFCIFMCLIFGGVLFGCGIAAIVNRDFWILLIAAASVMTAASVTVLPLLLADRTAWEPYKWAVSLGGMVFSVELTILFCCIRAGSMEWFPMVALWVLTGSSFVLLPVVLSTMPLPPALANRKASLYFAVGTVLLLLTMFAMSWDTLYGHGFDLAWFAVAAMAVCLGLGFIALPIFLQQLPLPEKMNQCKASLFIGIQSTLLLLLLTACCGYGDAWEMCPTVLVSVLLGLSVAFLPVPLRQVWLPENLRRHKALLYFAVNTLLLFLTLAVTTKEWFFPMSAPIALLGLTLPWGLMGIIRYLPVNRWFRASIYCVWTALWSWLVPWMMDQIMLLNGWANSTPYRLRLPCDFSRWDDPKTVGWNVFLLVLLGLAALTVGFAAAGIAQSRKKKA